MVEVPGHDFVGGVDDRVAGCVARFADGVAEVEDVGFGEARGVGGLDGHLQPLGFDRVVFPEDRHAIGTMVAGAGPHGDRHGAGAAGQVYGSVELPTRNSKSSDADRLGPADQGGNVDHHAVDAQT